MVFKRNITFPPHNRLIITITGAGPTPFSFFSRLTLFIYMDLYLFTTDLSVDVLKQCFVFADILYQLANLPFSFISFKIFLLSF